MSGVALTQGVGEVFWIKKTLTSSAILTTATDLTNQSRRGDLVITDVILKTDGTGLATGTNFVLSVTNSNGDLTLLSTAVSGLGANKTVDLANATVSGMQTVLEVGKKVTFECTGSACTGAGTVDVYLKLERLRQGASVMAA